MGSTSGVVSSASAKLMGGDSGFSRKVPVPYLHADEGVRKILRNFFGVAIDNVGESVSHLPVFPPPPTQLTSQQRRNFYAALRNRSRLKDEDSIKYYLDLAPDQSAYQKAFHENLKRQYNELARTQGRYPNSCKIIDAASLDDTERKAMEMTGGASPEI